MSGHGGGKKKGRRGAEEPGHADERWLVSYADMITLLMAMFLVMWSMASVNTSKFESLAASLREAFSGKILPGGEAVMQPGNQSKAEQASPQPPIPTIVPVTSPESSNQSDGQRSDAPKRENEDLQKLKKQIDQWTEEHGLSTQVQTTVARRGLVVTVLTDRVLFASGSADVKPRADSLLDALARLLKTQVRNPIQVEGNTDNVPVSGRYPTNWELSTARATAVVRGLIGRGVNPNRLSATGYADRHPTASNATESGRRRNRRVELVVLRNHADPGQGGQENSQGGTRK
jgi:chemotaxis protein MotB